MCTQSEKEEIRKNSGKFPPFKQRFLQHVNAGTRPDRKAGAQTVPWDAASLSKALAVVMKGTAPDVRTIRNWLNNNDIPQERFIVPILTILFGDDPALAEQRTELQDSWRLSRQAPRPSAPATQSMQSNHPPDPDPVPPAAEQWKLTDAENIGLGLAALYLHLPATNDANNFLLQVSLSFARRPDEIEGVSVRCGLKTARIVPSWTHCQPVEWMEQDHVTEAAGEITVNGPRDEASGPLVGRTLSNSALIRVAPTGGGLPAVTLSLRSLKRNLEVVPDDPAQDISNNRAKFLQLFLQECQVSESARMVTWSRSRLERKPD